MKNTKQIKLIDGSIVTSKKVPSSIRVDLSGKRFGRILVVGYAGRLSYGKQKQLATTWIGKCDCGNFSIFISGNLIKGQTTQCNPCGCILAGKKNKTHGCSKTSTYHKYYRMVRNCSNSFGSDWNKYGKNGITVCLRWKTSFEAFMEDMGECPTKNHGLDRINKNGNFEPSNCYWATKKQRSTAKMYTLNGKSMCLLDWAKKVGISRQAMFQRLNRYPPEVALVRSKLPGVVL